MIVVKENGSFPATGEQLFLLGLGNAFPIDRWRWLETLTEKPK
jgi:hypothetical protein